MSNCQNCGAPLQGEQLRWIPVTEMLPEPNETVLVYRKFWNFGMDRYDGESFIHNDVTHWIPMPRLPEKV